MYKDDVKIHGIYTLHPWSILYPDCTVKVESKPDISTNRIRCILIRLPHPRPSKLDSDLKVGSFVWIDPNEIKSETDLSKVAIPGYEYRIEWPGFFLNGHEVFVEWCDPSPSDFELCGVIDKSTGSAFTIPSCHLVYVANDHHPETDKPILQYLVEQRDELLAACKKLIDADHYEHFAARLNDQEMEGIEAIKKAIQNAESYKNQ